MSEQTAEIKRKAWEEHRSEETFVLTMSLIGTAGLSLFIYIFFWRVPLWFTAVEDIVYSWGAVWAALAIYSAFKAPRVITQTSGDEWVAITEVFLTLIPLGLLLLYAGRASTAAVNFPPTGQFGFWLILAALLFVVGLQVYVSMRLAERTIEAGLIPPGG